MMDLLAVLVLLGKICDGRAGGDVAEGRGAGGLRGDGLGAADGRRAEGHAGGEGGGRGGHRVSRRVACESTDG